jgi:hypothetical protein
MLELEQDTPKMLLTLFLRAETCLTAATDPKPHAITEKLGSAKFQVRMSWMQLTQ